MSLTSSDCDPVHAFRACNAATTTSTATSKATTSKATTTTSKAPTTTPTTTKAATATTTKAATTATSPPSTLATTTSKATTIATTGTTTCPVTTCAETLTYTVTIPVLNQQIPITLQRSGQLCQQPTSFSGTVIMIPFLNIRVSGTTSGTFPINKVTLAGCVTTAEVGSDCTCSGCSCIYQTPNNQYLSATLATPCLTQNCPIVPCAPTVSYQVPNHGAITLNQNTQQCTEVAPTFTGKALVCEQLGIRICGSIELSGLSVIIKGCTNFDQNIATGQTCECLGCGCTYSGTLLALEGLPVVQVTQLVLPCAQRRHRLPQTRRQRLRRRRLPHRHRARFQRQRPRLRLQRRQLFRLVVVELPIFKGHFAPYEHKAIVQRCLMQRLQALVQTAAQQYSLTSTKTRRHVATFQVHLIMCVRIVLQQRQLVQQPHYHQARFRRQLRLARLRRQLHALATVRRRDSSITPVPSM